MRLYPSIEILEGHCVRLVRGERATARRYRDDPVAWAAELVAQGAPALHVVDLDAAFGEEPQTALLEQVLRAVDVPVQIGGGLRDLASVERVLELGASRAVLGTAAVEDPSFVIKVLAEHGADRVAIALDVREGEALVRGRARPTGVPAADLVRRLQERGAELFIYTAIARDGTLAGPDFDGVLALCEEVPRARLIVSGGIGSTHDLARLRAEMPATVEGAIVGKALYEGTIRLPEALEALGCARP